MLFQGQHIRNTSNKKTKQNQDVRQLHVVLEYEYFSVWRASDGKICIGQHEFNFQNSMGTIVF